MKTILAIFCLTLVLAFANAAEVNINTADATAIATSLKGVGLSKAEAIVAYRDANGPFGHLDELVKVKGIGLRTVEINRDNIRLTSVNPGKGDAGK